MSHDFGRICSSQEISVPESLFGNRLQVGFGLSITLKSTYQEGLDPHGFPLSPWLKLIAFSSTPPSGLRCLAAHFSVL